MNGTESSFPSQAVNPPQASSDSHPPSTSARGDQRPPRRGRGGGERGRRGNYRGSRGRGRGEGGGGEQQRHRRLSSASQHVNPTRPLLSPKERSNSTSKSQQATQAENVTQDRDSAPPVPGLDGASDDAEVCFICASPVIHYAVAPCNHVTCHICALRLRALYKSKSCAHCRTNAEYIIFTDQGDKRFQDFQDQDVVKTDSSLGIKYEKNEILEDTVLLLRYNCPDPSCDVACYGWPDLHRHVRNVHHRVMCDLCTRNKKVFTHEHELFTQASLRKHERQGDDNPGAVDQSGFRGHPECGFCKERFYGDDELYTHCRDKHERCHICDRIQPGRQQQYYLDYSQLEVHFRKDHYLCLDQECLEQKFVVFASEMDLKAHQLETHPNGLSKDARRDARRVDMSGFDYRQAHQEARGGRREPHGRGRGRDPNVDALPVSSAQPLRRDELAYQRQLAIHSAQSISNRTFGGQLTSSTHSPATAPTNIQEPATVTVTPGNLTSNRAPAPQNNIPYLESLSIDNSRSLSPTSRARALRHNSVLERASNLLGNDTVAMTNFRNYISQYRSSTIPASTLIDSFFTLFDPAHAPANEIGTLIKELADIFEVPGKKEELLKAWNDWRAINEDYPSLPGGVSTGSSGKRILKLKSSTAKSNRSAANRSATWGNVAGGPSVTTSGTGLRNGIAFPAMPSSSGSSRSTASKPAWVTPASAATGASRPAQTLSSATATPSRTAPTNPSKAPSADAFPALPTAQKLAMNVSRPGFTGNPRLQRSGGSNTPVSAWSSRATPANGELAAVVDAGLSDGGDEEGVGAARAKGKGKGKKVFMHWG